jgi:capsular polysaccharide biosynthesis protein
LAQTSLESQARQAGAALLTRATEPATPSSPKYLRTLGLGLAFGIALGIAVALCLEMLDQRVRRDAELPQLLGVPLLATFAIRSESARAPQLFGSLASRAIGFRAVAARALTHQQTPQ